MIYHEDVVEDEAALLSVLPTEGVEYPEGFPVEGEMKLNFEKSSMPMGGGDYRFDKLLLDVYNEANPDARVTSLDRPRRMIWIKCMTSWIWEATVLGDTRCLPNLTRGNIIQS